MGATKAVNFKFNGCCASVTGYRGAGAQRDLQEAFARGPIQRSLLVLVGFVGVSAGSDEGDCFLATREQTSEVI